VWFLGGPNYSRYLVIYVFDKSNASSIFWNFWWWFAAIFPRAEVRSQPQSICSLILKIHWVPGSLRFESARRKVSYFEILTNLICKTIRANIGLNGFISNTNSTFFNEHFKAFYSKNKSYFIPKLKLNNTRVTSILQIERKRSMKTKLKLLFWLFSPLFFNF
jgi:hypothetical protein